MKSKEEIDELYHKFWNEFSNKYDDNLHYYSFVEGYTQCQEDMADKKYTKEDMIGFLDWSLGMEVVEMLCNNKTKQEIFQAYINSLNKQD